MGFFDIFKKKKDDLTQAVEDAESYKSKADAPVVGSSDYSDNRQSPPASGGRGEMTIQDVFSITGRGTVVTGKISSGSFTTSSNAEILRADGSRISVKIDGIEMFRKILNTASEGDNVGILLEKISRNDVSTGDTLRQI